MVLQHTCYTCDPVEDIQSPSYRHILCYDTDTCASGALRPVSVTSPGDVVAASQTGAGTLQAKEDNMSGDMVECLVIVKNILMVTTG